MALVRLPALTLRCHDFCISGADGDEEQATGDAAMCDWRTPSASGGLNRSLSDALSSAAGDDQPKRSVPVALSWHNLHVSVKRPGRKALHILRGVCGVAGPVQTVCACRSSSTFLGLTYFKCPAVCCLRCIPFEGWPPSLPYPAAGPSKRQSCRHRQHAGSAGTEWGRQNSECEDTVMI